MSEKPDESRAQQHAEADELRYALAPLREVELRKPGTPENGSRDLTLTGYAAVFNQETTLYDGSFERVREVIQPGAFRDVLQEGADVHLLIGHNLDLPMARTGVKGRGGLELSEDQNGLRVFARLNPDVSYIADLARLMDDGVVDQMSFAFTVDQGGSEYQTSELEDGRSDTLRTIKRVSGLYDVTVTPQGAYRQTSASIRSLAGLSRRAPEWAGEVPVDHAEEDRDGGTDVGHAEEDRGGFSHVERARMLAELQRAKSKYQRR